ncbi:hypothetical protein GJAV_G00156520 [Gymnothorax javanicus]|nr:hypothetical protein GJAV_G00156520 [Gymnothorax javanicus]
MSVPWMRRCPRAAVSRGGGLRRNCEANRCSVRRHQQPDGFAEGGGHFVRGATLLTWFQRRRLQLILKRKRPVAVGLFIVLRFTMALRCASPGLILRLLAFAVTCTRLDASSVHVDQELSNIMNELWRLDTNRLKPGTDYNITLQGKAGYVAQGTNTARDYASAPLFSYVDEHKLKSIKTYSKFLDLLDNYEKSTGSQRVGHRPRAGRELLLFRCILQTEVMKPHDTHHVRSTHTIQLNAPSNLWQHPLSGASPDRGGAFTIAFLGNRLRGVTHTVVNADKYRVGGWWCIATGVPLALPTPNCSAATTNNRRSFYCVSHPGLDPAAGSEQSGRPVPVSLWAVSHGEIRLILLALFHKAGFLR